MSAALTANSPELVKAWETEPVLKVPESVLYDEGRQILFVSNVDGKEPWAKDGKGSIAKLGLDGEIIDMDWINGLQGPKGMGLHQGQLYVADINRLVVINVEEGAISRTVTIDGAEKLNDVSVGKDGVVYVSDSGTGRIHRVRNGRASVFAEDFKSPNGVLAADGGLYVLADEKLYHIKEGQREVIAEGIMGHVDGIEKVDDNSFIVSDWNGTVYYVQKGQTPQKLLDTKADEVNAADIGYNPGKRIVYVPTFRKNSVAAYRLK